MASCEGWGDDGKLRELAQGLLHGATPALRSGPSPASRDAGDGPEHSDGGFLSTAATSVAGGSILSTPHNEPEDDDVKRGGRSVLSRSATPELVEEERSFEALSIDSPRQPGAPRGGEGGERPAAKGRRRKKTRRQKTGGGRAERPPRVAGLTIERRFAVPRYDELAPVAPDLSQSQSDFFPGLFDRPAHEGRGAGDVRPRPRPFSALGLVRARPSEPRGSGALRRQHGGGGAERDAWQQEAVRQEHVARSRESFGRLAIDAAAAHPASFAALMQASLPTAWHQRQSPAVAVAARASNGGERRDAAAAARQARRDACESPHSTGTSIAKGARRAGGDDLALQQRVDCEDAAPHVTATMHPAQPSVQITFSGSASERHQQRPRSRCESGVGARAVHASPTRRATQLAGNDADAPRRVSSWSQAKLYDKNLLTADMNDEQQRARHWAETHGHSHRKVFAQRQHVLEEQQHNAGQGGHAARSPAAVTRPHDAGEHGTSARRLPAGSPDKFAVTCSGPGPGVYLLKPNQIGNACQHPPSRSARIGSTKRGSYLEDAINRTKRVPPVGTYETAALDAGGSGRAMRISKARRSPSACFPREERVCCIGSAFGPREANVVYDDVRMSAYRSWMG